MATQWGTATAPTPGTPTTINPTGLINTTPAGYTPEALPDAAQTTAANWAVDTPQTVQGQLAGITESGSPLMQRAETRAAQQANRRGLINSSMAVQAGQAALYDAALPIAQQDATVNATAAQANAGAQQQANLTNTQAQNQFTMAGTDAANAAASQKAGAQNQLTQQSNTANVQVAQSNAEAANKMSMQNLDNQFKTAISNADAQSKAYLQDASDLTKNALATIESNYKTIIASNEQAQAMYSKSMQNITDIVNNTAITDAVAKQTAINNQLAFLKTGMGMLEAFNGLELSSLLTF